MKVVMVTGSFPPDVCGAGHYTEQLVTALNLRGVSVEVITGARWGLGNAPSLLRRISESDADITHIQYPTVGYGRKLGPQFVALFQRGVVTLHEASQTHILRRLSLYPFFLAHHIIFTNRFEQAYCSRIAPWVSQRSSVIHIGSNMPVGHADGERTLNEIIYFGLIRPAKGLENVLELASILKQRGSRMSVRVIGLSLSEHQRYLESLQARSASLPIVWDLGLPDAATADRLARAAYAYAPYPDGASERRGSLLALLANGVATVTTRGEQTPPALDKVVEFAASPAEAAVILDSLAVDAGRRRRLSELSIRYASQFSWSTIADQHIKVYRTVVTSRGVRAA